APTRVPDVSCWHFSAVRWMSAPRPLSSASRTFGGQRRGDEIFILLLCRDRFHQQGERFSKTHSPRLRTFVVSHTDDDEIVRRDDQGCLAAGTRHVIGVPR